LAVKQFVGINQNALNQILYNSGLYYEDFSVSWPTGDEWRV